jgi:hypothetical protein
MGKGWLEDGAILGNIGLDDEFALRIFRFDKYFCKMGEKNCGGYVILGKKL